MWLAGFFNPQSFLTAIMQSMARKNEWPLDKMCLSVEVTKKNREDMTAPPREGSYVYGLFMEGNEGAGQRKLPEPVPLGWRAETSWEGAGGRGARKGHVGRKLDAGGDGGASLRTPSDSGPETKPAAQGSQPGSAWPETAGASLGVSTCFRAVRNTALPEGLGAGSPGRRTTGGASVPAPVPPPRGRASSSREGASRPYLPCPAPAEATGPPGSLVP